MHVLELEAHRPGHPIATSISRQQPTTATAPATAPAARRRGASLRGSDRSVLPTSTGLPPWPACARWRARTARPSESSTARARIFRRERSELGRAERQVDGRHARELKGSPCSGFDRAESPTAR